MHCSLAFTSVCPCVRGAGVRARLEESSLCRRVFLTLPQEDVEARVPASNPLWERRLLHQTMNGWMHKEVAEMQKCVLLYLHGHSDWLPVGRQPVRLTFHELRWRDSTGTLQSHTQGAAQES